MSYNLSIAVYGPGDDPQYRSHWGLIIHSPGGDRGILFHVELINREKLWYQFNRRDDQILESKSSEGYFLVHYVPTSEYPRVAQVIENESAPMDGIKRCQDWVCECLSSLEIEELIPSGTCEWIFPLVGLPASEVAQRVGSRWTSSS